MNDETVENPEWTFVKESPTWIRDILNPALDLPFDKECFVPSKKVSTSGFLASLFMMAMILLLIFLVYDWYIGFLEKLGSERELAPKAFAAIFLLALFIIALVCAQLKNLISRIRARSRHSAGRFREGVFVLPPPMDGLLFHVDGKAIYIPWGIIREVDGRRARDRSGVTTYFYVYYEYASSGVNISISLAHFLDPFEAGLAARLKIWCTTGTWSSIDGTTIMER